MKVYITTRTVGSYFGTVGQVRQIGSNRLLVETDPVPYQFFAAARANAEGIAMRKGWVVVDDADGLGA